MKQVVASDRTRTRQVQRDLLWLHYVLNVACSRDLKRIYRMLWAPMLVTPLCRFPPESMVWAA